MAELKPGHPDELIQILRNWLDQARSPIGSLPEGSDPVEWAVRQFVDYWKDGARREIDQIEASLKSAISLCKSGGPLLEIQEELYSALQALQEGLRDELGLYDWNKGE